MDRGGGCAVKISNLPKAMWTFSIRKGRNIMSYILNLNARISMIL
jgi:hypothetical protein